MLNSILSKYSKRADHVNTFDDPESQSQPTKPKKNKNEETQDFLNESENLSMKKKCDDVLKKYCTLYTEDEETDKNKFSVKPLNYKFLEQKQRRVQHAKPQEMAGST